MKVHFVTYRDEKKEWRWRLKTRNGRIVADSGEGYKTHHGCAKAISMFQLAIAKDVGERGGVEIR